MPTAGATVQGGDLLKLKEVDRASMKQTAAARSTTHMPARSVIEDN